MKTHSSPKTNGIAAMVCRVVALLALLAVPAAAQVAELLHETVAGSRDNYTGVIGCEFTAGSSNVVVSHLGIYNLSGTGLAASHHAGIFDAASGTLLGSVALMSSTVYYLTNSYQYVQLDPPLLLSSNRAYILAGDVASGDGDVWADSTSYNNWNPYFVGAAAGAIQSAYSGGGLAWPGLPTGFFGPGTSYGNVILGNIPAGPARVGVVATNVAVSVGQPVALAGFASGAPNISYQWYEGTTLLAGQIAPQLSLASATLADSGIYYLTASNSLGGEQSAGINLAVSAVPVSVSLQPTNLTVLQNFPAAFTVGASGSPPIAYQWSLNGAAIAGATNPAYTFTAMAGDNGDAYACTVSNFISGTPHTAVSSQAVLTVTPNLTLPSAFLHGYQANLPTNTFIGCLGGSFVTGTNPTVVTHLGFYAANYTDATHASLTDNHAVYIFNADFTTNTSVVVSNGTALPVVDGYIWASLAHAVTLAPNTTYILGADTTANDPSGDTYVVTNWSGYYTIPANSGANQAKYNASDTAPYYGGYSGQMFSAPNLGILQAGAPTVTVSSTNVAQYAGLNATVTAVVNGAPPVTGQWFKAPATPTGQTNMDFTLNNAQISDSGTYYLAATNTIGVGQSPGVTITISADAGPSFTQDLISQAAFVYSTVTLGVGVTGTPPIGYQWMFNSTPIAGATNATLVLTDVSSSTAGNYQVVASNAYGTTPSAVGTLSVQSVRWGGYNSAVMGPALLAYYPFADAGSGLGVATNQGALGFADDGTYEGAYTAAAGPANVANLEPGSMAVALDGLTSDVLIPALGVTVTNATIAAWVYSSGNQADNTAIYFHRGNSVFGLALYPDSPTNGNTLKYTWNNNFFNFQSGLTLPTNQWALVALTVATNQAVLYLQDGTGLQSATNVAVHSPVTFDSVSYAGWDTAGGNIGRRWTGDLANVMLFNTSLTAQAVNALYLGVPASATLTLTRSGGGVMLTWPGGTLQEAASVTGPWTSDNASSPFTAPASGARKFYRVLLQP